MAKAREWSSLRKTTELLATLPSLWQSVLAPWLQRNFPACEACGSLLRFIGVVMRGRHYSNRKPFWSFLWGKGENRAAKRLNICLEWLVLSLPMPPALCENMYMHLKTFLISTIGWRTAEFSVHWGLSFTSSSCSGDGVGLPGSLSMAIHGPLYESWAARTAPDQPLKAWDELLGCWWSNLPPGIAGRAAFHLQHSAEAAAPCSPWGAGRQWDVHHQHRDPSHGVVALCIWHCSSTDAFTVWNFFPYSAAEGQSLLQMFSMFTGKRMRSCRFI